MQAIQIIKNILGVPLGICNPRDKELQIMDGYIRRIITGVYKLSRDFFISFLVINLSQKQK
jgi:hypothetical protein